MQDEPSTGIPRQPLDEEEYRQTHGRTDRLVKYQNSLEQRLGTFTDDQQKLRTEMNEAREAANSRTTNRLLDQDFVSVETPATALPADSTNLNFTPVNNNNKRVKTTPPVPPTPSTPSPDRRQRASQPRTPQPGSNVNQYAALAEDNVMDTESTNATDPNQTNSPMQNNDSAATSGTSLNSDSPRGAAASE